MVLLLSWDAGERIRDRVSIAPLTSTFGGLDAEVALSKSDGVPRRCVVNLDEIGPVPYTIIRQDGKVCHLSEAKLWEVSWAIHLALGMRLPCPLRQSGSLLQAPS